jgi:hypothetical protein
MKVSEKEMYKPTDDLRQILNILKQKKFVLDCGHHVTFNRVLGNNLIIHNGVELKIICVECGY